MMDERIEIMNPESAGRSIGRMVESNVLDSQESKLPIHEELRQLLRHHVESSGINLGKLSGDNKNEDVLFGGVSLREAEYKNTSVGAAVLVCGLLGKDRTDRLVDATFGEIWANNDSPKAETQEEMMIFVRGIVDQITEKGGDFKLDIAKLSEDVKWKKVALYRLEAVMHVSYKLLRVVAMTSEGESDKYQSDRLDKFRQRVVKGHLEKVGRENAAPQVLAMEESEIVRHLNPNLVGVILEQLTTK